MQSLRSVFNDFEAQGTVFGSINKKDFHAIRCQLPPEDLVRQFDVCARRLDDRIESNELESHILAAVRGTLLPKLISGELRVKDAERIVTEATT